MRKSRVFTAMIEVARRYGRFEVTKARGKAHGDVTTEGKVVAKLQSSDIHDLHIHGFLRETVRSPDGRVRTYESTPYLTTVAKREEL